MSSVSAAIACLSLLATAAHADQAVSSVAVRAVVSPSCRVEASWRARVALVVRCGAIPTPAISIVSLAMPPPAGDVTVLVNL